MNNPYVYLAYCVQIFHNMHFTICWLSVLVLCICICLALLIKKLDLAHCYSTFPYLNNKMYHDSRCSTLSICISRCTWHIIVIPCSILCLFLNLTLNKKMYLAQFCFILWQSTLIPTFSKDVHNDVLCTLLYLNQKSYEYLA